MVLLPENIGRAGRNLCKTAWDRPYGFVVIDLSSGKYNEKYRSGFERSKGVCGYGEEFVNFSTKLPLYFGGWHPDPSAHIISSVAVYILTYE